MAVTAALVKELRERTGAGMMECKKALVETNGDMDTAIENLRKSGLAKADKKAGRVAAEGKVVVDRYWQSHGGERSYKRGGPGRSHQGVQGKAYVPHYSRRPRHR